MSKILNRKIIPVQITDRKKPQEGNGKSTDGKCMFANSMEALEEVKILGRFGERGRKRDNWYF